MKRLPPTSQRSSLPMTTLTGSFGGITSLMLCDCSETPKAQARYELYLGVGRYLQVDGRIKEAVSWLSECYSWRQSHFPEDYPSRLASQHALALAYEADGQVSQAFELLEHLVLVHKKVLAEGHPSRLTSQYALAGVYQANGQVREAIELLEHVVTIRENVLAEVHPSRLVSQHALLSLYAQQPSNKERKGRK